MQTFGSRLGSRDNQFDRLRLCLAALVVVSHCYVLLGLHDALYHLTSASMDIGALAVDGFFVISGFLVAASWERSASGWEYARKRARRILPGYLAVLAVIVLVVMPLGGAAWPHYLATSEPWSFLIHPLTGGALVPTPSVFTDNFRSGRPDGSLWTIRYEIFCYCGLALLARLGALRRPWTLLALALLTVSTLRWHWWPRHVLWLDDLGPLARLVLYFLGGVLAYAYRFKIPYRTAWAILSGIAVLLTVRHGVNYSMPIFGTYLFLYLGLQTGRPLKHDLSYGVYLYAYPIQQYLIYRVQQDITPAALLAETLIPVTVAAWLSWRYIEAPFLERAKKAQPAGPHLLSLEI